MKILLIHQYFKTPEEGSGIRSFHLAQSLSKGGHELIILSGHNHISGIRQFDGFQVRYFKIPYANEFGFFRRSISFFKFVLACQSYLKEHPKADYQYIMSTPLTTGFIGLYGLRKFRIPYFFEVGDLWPEAPVQLGFLKNPLLKAYFYRLEKKIYQKSSYIIALSPSIASYIREKIGSSVPILIVPNMADCDFFTFDEIEGKFFNKQNPFQIAYTGALGYANQVSYFLDLASVCYQRGTPVLFHIMGEGAEYDQILKRSKNIPNVLMHTYGSKAKVKNLLDQCDAVYVSYRKVSVLNTGSPNKLFDGLAAGKIIFLTVDGWMKELVKEADCGFSYNPDTPESARTLIEDLINQPDRIFGMKRNARKLAEERFSVEICTGQLIQVIENLKKANKG